jgi:hypothetical protein
MGSGLVPSPRIMTGQTHDEIKNYLKMTIPIEMIFSHSLSKGDYIESNNNFEPIFNEPNRPFYRRLPGM